MSDHLPVAGGSARAEFERRRVRYQERAKQRRSLVLGFGIAGVVVGLVLNTLGPTWGLLGWAIVALSMVSTGTQLLVLPQHVRAWDTGADGEECTAALLAPLKGDGFRMFHDRRIRGSRANIDHIVIGPPGVFAIETKSYQRDVRIRRGELLVAGRRRTGIIEQAKREAAAVAATLPSITVTPLVCIHRANLPWGRLELDGVRVVSPKGLVRFLREGPELLSGEEVKRLAGIVGAGLADAST